MTKSEMLFVLALLGVAYYLYTRKPPQPMYQPLPAFPQLPPQPAFSDQQAWLQNLQTGLIVN